MRLEELASYEIVEKKPIDELNSMSYIMRHRKTGARISILENDDENKVFYIGFRTPPVDSTGAAHIIEHTVLCGSDKFPVKDPFIELAKGSLNTFLNAMTYPDKTIYPIASCNDKDFQNLMHVYLDAVFYPNIYKEEKIFKQEGWHYEMESPESDLTLNGVVYNEMKGAFSSSDDVLEREIMSSLFPDTSYGFESGGDPDVIPTLTYEKFLDFHRRYYHPSNSYIYLYGNMDMAEKLDFIDREYLSSFEMLTVDSELKLQKPFESIKEIHKQFSISEGESEENNTYLSLSKVVGDNLDRELYVAFQILDYALCSAPGAPLKQALIEKNIGNDVYSVYDEGMKQPYFSVISKNANLNQRDEFLKTYYQVLEHLAHSGIDKKSLYAGLNYFEFKHREADFGSYPKGLMYGLQILDSWLHDDNMPFIHVEANDTYNILKGKIETDYFEKLIETHLLNNEHGSVVILEPCKGLTAKKDQKLAEKLQQFKNTLSKEEIEKIVAQTKELKAYQESEDSPEDLAKIPHLTIGDMKKQADTYVNDVRAAGDTCILFHPLFTNGIGYLRLMFDCSQVPEKLFPYLGIMRTMIGLIDTEHHNYGDLYNDIHIKTGGMAVVMNSYTRAEDFTKYKFTFDLKAKVLYTNLPDAFALAKEMMLTTKWSDHKRILELLQEVKSRMQSELLSAGHSVSAQRALSYLNECAAANDLVSGIGQYRLLEKLTDDFNTYAVELSQNLEELAKVLFRAENLMVDYTAQESGYEQLVNLTEDLKSSLYHCECQKAEKFHPVVEKKNEGFLTSSQVQYVCRAGNYEKNNQKYTGALRVLKVMMGYDYLWNNVRVKGGAYGCMCNFGKTGDSYFVSYRDPNLEKTIEIYEKAADYVSNVELQEEELTQFIIGAIGELDTPKTPQGKGNFSLSGYMTGLTEAKLQQERDEILHTTNSDIQKLGAYIQAFMDDNCICVVGKEEKVKEAAILFEREEQLIH